MEYNNVKEYTVEREYLSTISVEEMLIRIIRAHLQNEETLI